MYNIQDFSIISTGNDSLLFFSTDYQKAVTEAINSAMAEYEEENNYNYADSEKALQLLCYEGFIEIRDRREKPTIHLMEVLRKYDPTEDAESFTLGYI